MLLQCCLGITIVSDIAELSVLMVSELLLEEELEDTRLEISVFSITLTRGFLSPANKSSSV